MIRLGIIEVAWSYILDFENEANPFREKKKTIGKWKKLAVVEIIENKNILLKGLKFANQGLRAKDSLHLACAIEAKCDYFLTTDDFIIKKTAGDAEISVLNPIDFIRII